MDTQKINELADHIEAVGGRLTGDGQVQFDMRDYAHPCGAPACFSGHCVSYFDPELYAHRIANDQVSDLHEDAADILDLSTDRANRLFVPIVEDNPEAYEIDAQQGANVLRHLAETGRINWNC